MELYNRLEQIILEMRPAFKREDTFEWFVLQKVYVGDGIKVGKEGLKMPGVKVIAPVNPSSFVVELLIALEHAAIDVWTY